MKLTLKQKQQIAAYFKRRPEAAGVYLYGSQIKNTAGPLSDVDVAVIIDPARKKQSFDLQLEYINAVEGIVKEDLAADVKILNNDLALIYQAAVLNDGQLIVNNKPSAVKSFVSRVSLLYPDFYPVLANYFAKMQERLKNKTYALE